MTKHFTSVVLSRLKGACARIWSFRKRRSVRWFFRLAAIPVVALLLALLYMSVVGLPNELSNKIIASVNPSPYEVRVERMGFDFLDGIVAYGVYADARSRRYSPLITANKVALRFDVSDLLRWKASLRKVLIIDGTCQLEFGGEMIDFEQLDMEIAFEDTGWRVTRSRSSVFGVDIVAKGRVVTGSRSAKDGVAPAFPGGQSREEIEKIWHSFLKELKASQFDKPPRADLSFYVEDGAPGKTDIQLSITAGKTRLRGVPFDQWNLDTHVLGSRVNVPNLMLQFDGGKATASGSINMDTKVLAFRAASQLPFMQTLHLFPSKLAAAVRDAGVSIDGPFRWELETEARPIDEVLRHLKGTVSFERADLKGVWVERAAATFVRNKDVVTFHVKDAVVGRHEDEGPFSIRGTWNTRHREYAATFTAAFNPRVMLPIMNVGQENIVRRFTFQEGPPSMAFYTSGSVGNPDAFSLSGVFLASNCVYNGSAMNSFRLPITITNRQMHIDPLLIVRDGGHCEGRVSQDFNNRLIDVDLESTIDPKAFARIAGPKGELALRSLSFEGPTHMTGRGKIDYGTNGLNDLVIIAGGEQVRWKWFVSDRCSQRTEVFGRKIEVKDVEGDLYGGTFNGYAAFYPDGETTNKRYEVNMSALGVNFETLVNAMNDSGKKKYAGKISGAVSVSGLAGEKQKHTALGGGHIKIEQGFLFEIPVLGGLSRLLSKIYAGAGFTSQTDLNMTFKIKDGKVTTKDLKMLGKILEIDATGSYHFSGELDFAVKVRPVEKGNVAAVVRVVTLPFTKLLEFQLTGTKDNPKWRPVNLPKELFLIFD